MPVEGLIRDFTDDTKSKLNSAIRDIEAQDREWYDNFGDWFSDTGYELVTLFGRLNIEDYICDLKDFHRQILDKKDTGEEQIEKIFSEVYAVENENVPVLKELNERLESYKKTVSSLSTLLDPSQSATCSLLSTPDRFSKSLALAGSGAISYFMDKLMTVNEDGTYTYDWDELAKIMAKNPEDVTTAEYIALAAMVNSMTVADANGNISANTSALEKFLESSYTTEMKSHLAMDLSSNYVEYKYTLSPVFQNFSKFYNATVNTLVTQNGDVLYSNNDSDESTRQYLQCEIFKAILLNEISTNIQSVTQYQDMTLMTGADPFKHLDLNISRHVQDGKSWYNIAPIDGFIGDYFTNGVNIYDFDSGNAGIIINNIRSLGESFYQSQSGEFLKSLGDEAVGKMLDSAIEMIGVAAGKIGVVVSAGKFTTDAAIQSIEIDINNDNVDELFRDLNLLETLSALQIGASVSDFTNRITINYAYINNRELQIALCAYNAYNKKEGETITVEEVKGALTGFTEDGNAGNEITDYVNWYMNNTRERENYRTDLQYILTVYCEENPDCKYKTVDSLSLEQITELNKKLSNPDYNLNLE